MMFEPCAACRPGESRWYFSPSRGELSQCTDVLDPEGCLLFPAVAPEGDDVVEVSAIEAMWILEEIRAWRVG